MISPIRSGPRERLVTADCARETPGATVRRIAAIEKMALKILTPIGGSRHHSRLSIVQKKRGLIKTNSEDADRMFVRTAMTLGPKAFAAGLNRVAAR